jgi:uncharacterized membrane protein (UPF0127 family)
VQGQRVCEACEVAASFSSRLRGLLGRRSLESGQGLLLPRTSSVHTFFMRFPIDVVFLDPRLRVRAIVPSLAPFRISGRLGRGAVLELPAGEADRRGLSVGDTLAWE